MGLEVARRRLGVMGGTFDPPHNGHLLAASEAQSRFDLDEVVFVPAGQPWQKSSQTVSSAEDRYDMTVIATVAHPSFSVSRVDLDRPGPTYTVDTLRDIGAAYPEHDLFFITGADALSGIGTWRDAEACLEMAHFVGCTRPGHQLDDEGLPRSQVTLLEIPALSISSSQCRARAAAGQPIWYLVPDGVVQYVAKRHMYRENGES